ncbi:hypothetical protein JA9_000783 [Meyerozyma sp. JA9]|nr:hypothetical protein JA9_000783 [Meyerozyma sp. JA9]
MYGTPFSRTSSQSSAPSHFKDSARNAIYQQLSPLVVTSNSAGSIRSAPSQYQIYKNPPPIPSHRSQASSVFSANRSVRSAPSIYSTSTATIPEDSEPASTTVDQLINDISLHEEFCFQKRQESLQNGVVAPESADDEEEFYKISLGSELQYQHPESLIDWNLNVTRCKLFIIHLPIVSSTPNFTYSNTTLPLLVGDLAKSCHIVLLQPHISDKELIYTLFSSNIYQEHNLDYNFKKSVAEISVKQSRLLQINSSSSSSPIKSTDSYLKSRFKETAVRNYLINLAAAATTAHEYKLKSEEIKKLAKTDPTRKKKLTKQEKKFLWDQVRSDVFKRAGLE